MNPKVNGYIRKNKQWQEELTRLRALLLDCPLTEDIKWRVPCYTFQEANVVLLNCLKEYCAISFFKGALLKDPKGVLLKPGENTQAARLIRFISPQQVADLEPTLKAYVHEAIEVEKAGLKVELKKLSDFEVPLELQHKLDEIPTFKAAFESLTPGRQRAYFLHISAPKQSKTRVARVEKCMPLILAGKGLTDDYTASLRRNQ